MVNIDTRNTIYPGKVTRTRKVARTTDTTVTQDHEAQAAQTGERRGQRKDRRKAKRRVLLDLRSGQDRRRASRGRGIDVEI